MSMTESKYGGPPAVQTLTTTTPTVSRRDNVLLATQAEIETLRERLRESNDRAREWSVKFDSLQHELKLRRSSTSSGDGLQQQLREAQIAAGEWRARYETLQSERKASTTTSGSSSSLSDYQAMFQQTTDDLRQKLRDARTDAETWKAQHDSLVSEAADHHKLMQEYVTLYSSLHSYLNSDNLLLAGVHRDKIPSHRGLGLKIDDNGRPRSVAKVVEKFKQTFEAFEAKCNKNIDQLAEKQKARISQSQMNSKASLNLRAELAAVQKKYDAVKDYLNSPNPTPADNATLYKITGDDIIRTNPEGRVYPRAMEAMKSVMKASDPDVAAKLGAVNAVQRKLEDSQRLLADAKQAITGFANYLNGSSPETNNIHVFFNKHGVVFDRKTNLPPVITAVMDPANAQALESGRVRALETRLRELNERYRTESNVSAAAAERAASSAKTGKTELEALQSRLNELAGDYLHLVKYLKGHTPKVDPDEWTSKHVDVALHGEYPMVVAEAMKPAYGRFYQVNMLKGEKASLEQKLREQIDTNKTANIQIAALSANLAAVQHELKIEKKTAADLKSTLDQTRYEQQQTAKLHVDTLKAQERQATSDLLAAQARLADSEKELQITHVRLNQQVAASFSKDPGLDITSAFPSHEQLASQYNTFVGDILSNAIDSLPGHENEKYAYTTLAVDCSKLMFVAFNCMHKWRQDVELSVERSIRTRHFMHPVSDAVFRKAAEPLLSAVNPVLRYLWLSPSSTGISERALNTPQREAIVKRIKHDELKIVADILNPFSGRTKASEQLTRYVNECLRIAFVMVVSTPSLHLTTVDKDRKEVTTVYSYGLAAAGTQSDHTVQRSDGTYERVLVHAVSLESKLSRLR